LYGEKLFNYNVAQASSDQQTKSTSHKTVDAGFEHVWSFQSASGIISMQFSPVPLLLGSPAFQLV
jgi:hypothetical protein